LFQFIKGIYVNFVIFNHVVLK